MEPQVKVRVTSYRNRWLCSRKKRNHFLYKELCNGQVIKVELWLCSLSSKQMNPSSFWVRKQEITIAPNLDYQNQVICDSWAEQEWVVRVFPDGSHTTWMSVSNWGLESLPGSLPLVQIRVSQHPRHSVQRLLTPSFSVTTSNVSSAVPVFF